MFVYITFSPRTICLPFQSRSEEIFQEMELLDSQKDCAKLYLCQLATIHEEVICTYLLICLHFFVYIYLFTNICLRLQNMLKEEKELLESLQAPNGEVRFESSSAAFEAAIELGLKYRNNDICSKRYFKCV